VLWTEKEGQIRYLCKGAKHGGTCGRDWGGSPCDLAAKHAVALRRRRHGATARHRHWQTKAGLKPKAR